MQLKNLRTDFLGRNCIHYKSIDSTQLEIWRCIEKQEKNGTVIIADRQTNGIGTHGRTWYTDSSNNIAFSFFLEMNCHIKKIEKIQIRIAEILIQILNEKYNIYLKIKEPNDIVYKDKKIGGILVQTKIISEQVKFLIVGIGINTNSENFREEIKDIATSIKNEFNIQIDNIEIITEFLNRFEEEIKELKKG